MYPFFLGPAILFSLSFLSNGVNAQCGSQCDIIGSSILGNSTGNCGVDPSDAAYPAYVYSICPCSDQVLTQYQTATDTNGNVVTASAIAAVTASHTAYVTFTLGSLPYASISAGAPVSLELDASYQGTAQKYTGLYTYTPVTSIFYAYATTTITQYTGKPTTTTSTMIVTSTSTSVQVTSLSKCATGTRTVKAAPTIKYTTITITPALSSATRYSVTTTKTTLSCLAVPQGHKRDVEARADDMMPRYATVTPFETPNCGIANATTYTTSTATSTTDVTTSDVITTIATSTTSVTVAPNPATTTLCVAYQATTRITPTLTSTRLSIAPRKTTTTTTTIIITQTIVPRTIKLCSTKPINGHTGSFTTLTPAKTTSRRSATSTARSATSTATPAKTTSLKSATSTAKSATSTFTPLRPTTYSPGAFATATVTVTAQASASATQTVTTTVTSTKTVTVTA